jgi:hypothetical protein
VSGPRFGEQITGILESPLTEHVDGRRDIAELGRVGILDRVADEQLGVYLGWRSS